MSKRKTKSLDALEAQPEPSAPLDGGVFLHAAKAVLTELNRDLLDRAKASACVTRALGARHREERDADRTGDSYDVWLRQFVGQVGAAWLLSTVFVRTLEDRGLLGRNRVAGPGALDSQRLFFELAPSLTERDYLLTVFRELSRFPAARALFDSQHNPVWALAPSAASAKKLLELLRLPDAGAPAFRFGQTDTRFLGDLYQDLDEAAKKRYALLQTPHFIESFILDRTLEPAIEHFGLDDTTLIDPTCGSGHFLLGAFDRLFERRLAKEPGLDARQAALKALDAVFGADINPYAVAIARFRLTLSFLEKAGFARLADAPELPLHLAVADSLLHNPHLEQRALKDLDDVSSREWGGELFALEDERTARDVLHRQYAAVVGNPPYITVKDKVLRDRYRSLYRSASGKYSVAVPFTERFFQLGRNGARVGMITANSFMKREFGQKLIEEFFPTVNLDVIINTSGAYIPGHGTPTVLLFGSSEPPKGSNVLAVLASRGEPSTPDDPKQGEVWSSIAKHWNEIDFENPYITVASVARAKLADHPWSLAGGGAAELKEALEKQTDRRLGDIIEEIGPASFTGLDDAFIIPSSTASTYGLEDICHPMVGGEVVRDWSFGEGDVAITPYDSESREPLPWDDSSSWGRFLWQFRTVAQAVFSFGGRTRAEEGQNWWEWYRWQPDRYLAPYRIAFAFVATHNHFVLDSGGKVFSRTAPIIKLPDTATEDDHLALLAYLNSSTACFWMKQVMMNKGATSDRGVLQPDEDKFRFEFDGTKLRDVPIPNLGVHWRRLVELGRRVDAAAKSLHSEPYAAALASAKNVSDAWADIRASNDEAKRRCVALQEEIDWIVYDAFQLTTDPTLVQHQDVDQLAYSQEDRPFKATMTKDLDDVRRARRRSLQNHTVSLIESSEFKRRWYRSQGKFNANPITDTTLMKDAFERYALSLVETQLKERSTPTSLSSIRRELIHFLARISDVCESMFGMAPWEYLSEAFELEALPYVAQLLYSGEGLHKRGVWERTWDLQRREDAGEDVGEIPVPPKYAQKDFRRSSYWRLRGKLDVPKERFISYPGCESDEDGEAVYGWAGWNHLERAQALAALYQDRKDREGWEKERLTPMLAGLLELIPWVKQWHNEPSDEYGGMKLGDYFESFLDGECQRHGLTREDLEAWRPPETKGRRKKRGARA